MAKTSTKEFFSKCIMLGTGSDRIVLSSAEVFSLLHQCLKDLNWSPSQFNIQQMSEQFPSENYFEIPIDWFTEVSSPESTESMEYIERLLQHDSDFGLFFMNLCSLHKRRIKYQYILSSQPKPTMEQIGPRGLLEYGLNNTELLANWMLWRKWIFDIDNRSGQETGYLFEPILASCLGGVPMSSSKSPVKRLDDDGLPKKEGRQVDCFVASENVAYEFKIRVTTAASGQGRFGEELSFPSECRAAGIQPILLVLDSTPSNRLTDLSNAFTSASGKVLIGDNAWEHMGVKAGMVVSVFIEKYIKAPLLAIGSQEKEELSSLQLTWTEQNIIVSDGQKEYRIKRK